MKKIGIVGIDRSGSRSSFPFVVASVYSDKMKDFETAIKGVREELRVKYGFIKGKDFKPAQCRRVMEILKDNNIHFLVYYIPQESYDYLKNILKLKGSWEARLEAFLWFKSLSLLVRKLKQLPTEVFYEATFTGVNYKIFDDTFKDLVEKILGIDRDSISVGEKASPYIVVADWLAHFFYSDPQLRTVDDSVKCKLELVEKDVRELFKIKGQSRPPYTHGPRLNRSPVNVRTINMMVGDIFKVFGHLKDNYLKGMPKRVIDGKTHYVRNGNDFAYTRNTIAFNLTDIDSSALQDYDTKLLRLEVNYTDDSLGKTTYLFSNTTDNKYGLQSMQKPWIVLMNYQANDQPLFVTTSKKTLSSIPLKVTADENEAITKLTFNQSFSSATNLTLAFGYLGTVNTRSDTG